MIEGVRQDFHGETEACRHALWHWRDRANSLLHLTFPVGARVFLLQIPQPCPKPSIVGVEGLPRDGSKGLPPVPPQALER